MIALSYISYANQRFSDEELTELLQQAHAFNRTQDITGLLLYNGAGTFLQLIEGEDDAIEALYKKIISDSRHSRVHCLMRKHISEKAFPSWKMGFRNLSKETPPDIHGFSDFMSSNEDAENLLRDGHFANELLNHFKNSANEIII